MLFFEYFMTTSQREITNKLLFVLQFKIFQSHSPKFTEHSRSFRNWFSTQNLPYHSYNGNYITELSDKKKMVQQGSTQRVF